MTVIDFDFTNPRVNFYDKLMSGVPRHQEGICPSQVKKAEDPIIAKLETRYRVAQSFQLAFHLHLSLGLSGLRLGNRPFLSLSLSTSQNELSAVNCLHQPCPFVRGRFGSCRNPPSGTLEASPATLHTSFRGSGGQGFQAINRASFCSSRFLNSRTGKSFSMH